MSARPITARISAACRRARRTGCSGKIATTATPTSPPTSESTTRSEAPPLCGGYSVATSTAELAACIGITAPRSRKIAEPIATATTKAICHGPVPTREMNRSPIPMPTLTPATSSTERRIRAPNATPMEMTAAIGAKYGAG